MLDVRGDRPHAHGKPIGDLPVVEPSGEKSEHVELARREAVGELFCESATIAVSVSWARCIRSIVTRNHDASGEPEERCARTAGREQREA